MGTRSIQLHITASHYYGTFKMPPFKTVSFQPHNNRASIYYIAYNFLSDFQKCVRYYYFTATGVFEE